MATEFTPRTYEQILQQMLAHVSSNSDVDDFTEGSAVLSILEASALEDDEQYFQMSQLLTMFSIYKARGEKLERRLADFGIFRLPAKSSTGKVRFVDQNLVFNTSAANKSAGSTSVSLFSTASFPVSGYPYVIRIAEGTTRMMDVSVTTNNVGTATFSLASALPYEVYAGDRVSLVTGAISRTINTGQVVQCPATQSQAARLFATTEQAYIEAGNYYSSEVFARCTVNGTLGNITKGKITQFVGSPPFSGAGVINTSNMSGARNTESDEELIKRAIEKLTGLSRGTVLALKSAAKDVEDPVTGQRVVSANIVENFVDKEVVLYIDDGSGFIPDYVSFPDSTLASSASATTTLSLVNGSNFPSSGNVLLVNGSSTTLKEYVSKSSVNSLFLSSSVSSFPSGTPVFYVHIISSSTEKNQTRFKINRFPIVRNTEIIWKLEPTGPWTQLTRDIDYILNKATGEIQLITALPENSSLVVSLDYYINLVASVQKVLEGDPKDELNYPGVKAAGVRVVVEAPSIKRIEVVLSIIAKPGYIESDLYDDIKLKVEQYISSLGLGEDVIISRIIDAVHDNAGVLSVKILEPRQNVVILENELPTVFDSNGDSLVQVI